MCFLIRATSWDVPPYTDSPRHYRTPLSESLLRIASRRRSIPSNRRMIIFHLGRGGGSLKQIVGWPSFAKASVCPPSRSALPKPKKTLDPTQRLLCSTFFFLGGGGGGGGSVLESPTTNPPQKTNYTGAFRSPKPQSFRSCDCCAVPCHLHLGLYQSL